MAAKTYLVTGAAGFIGSHLSDALLARGDAVVGLDDFNPYYDPALKRKNVEDVRQAAPDPARYTLIEGDVRDAARLSSLFAEHAVDVVVHLAAMAGVRASIERPELYLDVNLLGTQRLLEAMRGAGVGHLVLASTSSVYGATEVIPFVETDPADRPMAPYAATKRAAELFAYMYCSLHGLSANVLRFFTVYGPRNRPDMMAHKVLDSIYNGTVVPLYEGGEMWRDWTYVGDIVKGVIAAADRPDGYQTFNIGRGEPVHLGEFVKRLETLAGKKGTFENVPRPSTDVPKTWADCSRTRERLGYRPSTSIAEGAEQLFRWYVSEHSCA